MNVVCTVQLETLLGTLPITLLGGKDRVVATTIELPIEIMPGQSLVRRRAVVFELDGPRGAGPLLVRCGPPERYDASSPCNGEALEAFEWWSASDHIVVGTEDRTYLAWRVPEFEGTDEIGFYDEEHLTLRMPMRETQQKLSLHVVVAEDRPADRRDALAWLSVDLAHTYLLDLVADRE